ncbi:MAG TPA: pantoate--beta-alanine ligase [Firmicutes bacterium]|nr:pantoate--beta-alanine ligase [Bacillota bacterium]
MEVTSSIAEVRRKVAMARIKGLTIGLVPTMGALHQGHAALIDAARARCGYVVVSIFVNPLQFGPQEDLKRYPRRPAEDEALCREHGVDLIFAPSDEEMYPDRQLTIVEVLELTRGLCGASRPGHFRGVTTVVSKLFNIVQPDVAFFGQKDAQQAAVIRRMVADLNFPLEIAVVPTVREADGLALSSRNVYLSPEERKAAVVLYRALTKAKEMVEKGERSAAAVRRRLLETIAAEPLAELDYAEVVDYDTLEPVDFIDGKILLALAVKIGRTRLIDNFVVEVRDELRK